MLSILKTFRIFPKTIGNFNIKRFKFMARSIFNTHFEFVYC